MKRKKAKAMTMKPATATVENPNWRPDLDGERAIPRFITATVNVFESAIATMASRRQIDAAQTLAADRFRKLWEASGGVGAKAIDYSREPVDGGKIAEPISPTQMNAARQLGYIRETLGRRNFDLISKVCGEGRALGELFHEKRDKLTAADNLRASLDDMCTEWGISVTATSKPRRKYWTKQSQEQVTYSARDNRRALRKRH